MCGQFGEHFGDNFDVVEVSHGHNGPIGIFDWLEEDKQLDASVIADKEPIINTLEAAHQIAVIERSALIGPTQNISVIMRSVLITPKHNIKVRVILPFAAEHEIEDITQDILDICELIRRGLI